jgi:hypothetical protein
MTFVLRATDPPERPPARARADRATPATGGRGGDLIRFTPGPDPLTVGKEADPRRMGPTTELWHSSNLSNGSMEGCGSHRVR